MIGVFDSGYGGLTILNGLLKELPQYSYMYVGDNARAPYGSRPAEEILQFTTQGVEYLFSRGCPLVILACNTASANALRSIQENLLPAKYPDRRVLGILVPTIEQITGIPWQNTETLPLETREPLLTVGVLATEQTVASGAYEREIHKRSASIQVIQQACPDLTDLIEQGATNEELNAKVEEYVNALLAKITHPPLQAVLLGCTHYAIIADLISQLLPNDVHLYEQPQIVVQSLKQYLSRHMEVDEKITKKSDQLFLTTDDPAQVASLSKRFFGHDLTFARISL